MIEILDVLWDLAGRFELVILDDGSTDETPEVAGELAARYPQVRVIRHPVRLGLAEAVQTGLDHLPGEVMLVADEDYCFEADDLRTLWKLRDTQWRTSRDGGEHEPWMEKLLAWRSQARTARRGFQRVSREAFEQSRMHQAAELVGRVDGAQGAPLAIARHFGEPKFLNTLGNITRNR